MSAKIRGRSDEFSVAQLVEGYQRKLESMQHTIDYNNEMIDWQFNHFPEKSFEENAKAVKVYSDEINVLYIQMPLVKEIIKDLQHTHWID